MNSVQWFKAGGQWTNGSEESVSGMIILFYWDNKGSLGPQDSGSDHMGIVQKIENGMVFTVEGNTGDGRRINLYLIGNHEINWDGILILKKHATPIAKVFFCTKTFLLM